MDDKIYLTPADLTVLYVGPRHETPDKYVPLAKTGFAYSWDHAIKTYRWTAQRPLTEGCLRFKEKILSRVPTGYETDLAFLLVFNGEANKEGFQPFCLRFEGIKDIFDGLSIPATGGIVDVVSGLCAEPKPCETYPRVRTEEPQFR